MICLLFNLEMCLLIVCLSDYQKVGNFYVVVGLCYVLWWDDDYDEVGIGFWYGLNFYG